jgi:hypothetical protein
MNGEIIIISRETITIIAMLLVAGAWLLWDASKYERKTCHYCNETKWVRELYSDDGIRTDVCDGHSCQCEARLEGFS